MSYVLGTIFDYTLTENDAAQVNRRREDARDSVKADTVGNTGFSLHVGNDVAEGDIFPCIITRVWNSTRLSAVINGQVFLDGNDTLWVTSVKVSDD